MDGYDNFRIFAQTYLCNCALRSGVDLRTIQRNKGYWESAPLMGYLHHLDPEKRSIDSFSYESDMD